MISSRFRVFVINKRCLSTSQLQCNFIKKIKSKIIKPEDLKKRPSDLEIKEKNLPANTPTLDQRLKRDQAWKFHNSDRHGGYHLGPTGSLTDHIDADMTIKDIVIDGSKQLKIEAAMLKEEAKYYARFDHIKDVMVKPGDIRYLWNFKEGEGTTTQAINEDFIVGSDSVWGEGYSYGSVEAAPSQRAAVFCGDLSTQLPQDGRTKRAGYVNMKSITQRLAFGRKKFLPFEEYSAVILRIRGDGRRYFVNIHPDIFYDLNWFDLYQYPLYTRGGPYWQEVVIPYSKFVLTYKGHLQDTQGPFNTDEVLNLSVTLMDQISGPFYLEIESIGLKKLEGPIEAREDFAYEGYRMPHRLYLGSSL